MTQQHLSEVVSLPSLKAFCSRLIAASLSPIALMDSLTAKVYENRQTAIRTSIVDEVGMLQMRVRL